MSTETIVGPSKRVLMLQRNDADGVIAPAARVLGHLRCEGLQRVSGMFLSDQPPASGYPRVRQSADGTNWSLVTAVARDLSQAGYLFRFDFVRRFPYVQVEWTHGGVQGTYLRAAVEARAGLTASDDPIGSVSDKMQHVRTDKDTHFTGTLAQNAQETENVTGLDSNAGSIKSLAILSDQQLDWDVVFYSTDGFVNADADVDSYLGRVEFGAADGRQIAGTGLFRYDAFDLNLPYLDGDGTNELHVGLVNRSATAKAAGDTGEVVLRIGFQPQ